MILTFDPSPPLLKWSISGDGQSVESECEFGPKWPEQVFASIPDIQKLEAIAYFVYHGGDEIREPVSILTQTQMDRLARSIPFLPEYNDLIYKVAQFGFTKFPEILQVLFCETAFFTNLPEQSGTYAIPYELSRKGIKRYGGFGLFHQWAWAQSQNYLEKPPQKLISIYLNNHMNITAIKDGQPVETTIGFTPVEGLPSATGSGDIDPTIIFQLNSTGMSFEEINELLSKQSGYSGLLGKKYSIREIIRNWNTPEISEIQGIFRYNLQKYMGAFVSVLGGVDTIVFVSEYLNEAIPFISDICNRLTFLGTGLVESSKITDTVFRLSGNDANINIMGFADNKWAIAVQQIKTIIKERTK
jgi:acetate kinase